MDFPSTSQFISTTMKPSIDRVRFQIERLAASIHDVELAGEAAGRSIASRGEQTWNNMQDNFNKENQTIDNVNQLLDVVEGKFSNWPVDALFAALITALILILFGLLYLCAKGAEKFTKHKYRKTIPNDPSDIENI